VLPSLLWSYGDVVLRSELGSRELFRHDQMRRKRAALFKVDIGPAVDPERGSSRGLCQPGASAELADAAIKRLVENRRIGTEADPRARFCVTLVSERVGFSSFVLVCIDPFLFDFGCPKILKTPQKSWRPRQDLNLRHLA
jgi:hypothetical protein